MVETDRYIFTQVWRVGEKDEGIIRQIDKYRKTKR